VVPDRDTHSILHWSGEGNAVVARFAVMPLLVEGNIAGQLFDIVPREKNETQKRNSHGATSSSFIRCEHLALGRGRSHSSRKARPTAWPSCAQRRGGARGCVLYGIDNVGRG
jgi:hypothetical protein